MNQSASEYRSYSPPLLDRIKTRVSDPQFGSDGNIRLVRSPFPFSSGSNFYENNNHVCILYLAALNPIQLSDRNRLNSASFNLVRGIPDPIKSWEAQIVERHLQVPFFQFAERTNQASRDILIHFYPNSNLANTAYKTRLENVRDSGKPLSSFTIKDLLKEYLPEVFTGHKSQLDFARGFVSLP